MTIVTLVTTEGALVPLEPEIARQLGVIADALTVTSLDSVASRFPVPFDAQSIERLVQLCRMSQEAPSQYWWDGGAVENELAQLSADDLFGLLRASKWLECDMLFVAAARASARLLSGKQAVELCSEWDLREQALDHVSEPLFTPDEATDDIAAFPRCHLAEQLGDDDATAVVLLQCCMATIRELRGTSPGWRAAARRTLCSVPWREQQHTLMLDCLLSPAAPQWSDVATIALEMPSLQLIQNACFKISVRFLRDQMSTLDQSILHHAIRLTDSDGKDEGLRDERVGRWQAFRCIWFDPGDSRGESSAPPATETVGSPRDIDGPPRRFSAEASTVVMPSSEKWNCDTKSNVLREARSSLQLAAAMHTMATSVRLCGRHPLQ